MRFSILGNSGSGKSTLARWLAQQRRLSVPDFADPDADLRGVLSLVRSAPR